MQSTGLLDRSAVEVFEGDILKDINGRRYEITWDEKFCHFAAWTWLESPTKDDGGCGEELDLTTTRWISKRDYQKFCIIDLCEVVGNVWQHPELLPSI